MKSAPHTQQDIRVEFSPTETDGQEDARMVDLLRWLLEKAAEKQLQREVA